MKNLLYIAFVWSLIILSPGCTQKPPEQIRPNILFAISDDQSFEHTSFIGSKFVKTPAFDRIAREGIYFSNCIAGSPGCAPSRSSIVTGRYHWQNEQSGQHASSWMKKYVPFIDLLNKNGYATGRTGKGVGPFQYARNDQDSLWRKTNAAGIEHSQINIKEETEKQYASGISKRDYFENFKYFMENIRGDKPFFFWYGAHEPHRVYEKDSWKRMGKNLKDVDVPGFLPDDDLIRGDILDYAVEIEWFDLHLQRMLEYLEEIGELENTIVIVTSDNGMPFPRAKANCFEYGVHVPFAVRFPKKFPGGRIVADPVSFVDIAPTLLEITKTSSTRMLPVSGKSFLNILKSKKQGQVDPSRKYSLAGRERHSSSRYRNWGYPQRVIRNQNYIYIWNMKPERWPAGAPQKFDPKNPDVLLPMYGLDKNGKYIQDAAFTDIDDCPSKTFLIENHKKTKIHPYFNLAMEKRSEFELYDIMKDPYCLNNLSGIMDFRNTEQTMKQELMKVLKNTKDPRMVGPDKEIFDSYQRYSRIRTFPEPE
jgi:uncharacterized sulfatase